MPELSLSDLVPIMGDAVRRSIRVAGVARVESYDPATQTASIRLRVQEERIVDGVRTGLTPFVVEGCPVLHPGGLTRGLTMGLEAGDEVIALVRTQSHDEVDANEAAEGATGSVLPAARRRLDLSDVVVLPGYSRPAVERVSEAYSASGAPVLFMPGAEVFLVGDSTAAEALALASKVDARLSAIADDFNQHTHLSTTAGNPTGLASASTPPVTMGPFAPTDCDDIKVRS